MTFTDDDLKRLKAELDELEKRDPHGVILGLYFLPGMRALLARLEAAEVLAECLSNHEDLDPVERTQVNVWRKAAGK